MVMAAGPPVSQGRSRTLRVGLALAALWLSHSRSGPHRRPRMRGRCWSSPARRERPTPRPRPRRAALQAAGTAGDYTVDVTSDATKIAAANLAAYRAVVFVNSAGDVLNAAQEAALQAYVQDGGGFVGIGETAKLEEGATRSSTR